MAKPNHTPVIVLTRLKAGGKVWDETPKGDVTPMPDDLVEQLLEDGAEEEGLIRLAEAGDVEMGVAGLKSIEQAAVEVAIRALPEGEAPTAKAINDALKAAKAGFTVKLAQIEAVAAALKTAED